MEKGVSLVHDGQQAIRLISRQGVLGKTVETKAVADAGQAKKPRITAALTRCADRWQQIGHGIKSRLSQGKRGADHREQPGEGGTATILVIVLDQSFRQNQFGWQDTACTRCLAQQCEMSLRELLTQQPQRRKGRDGVTDLPKAIDQQAMEAPVAQISAGGSS